MLVKGIYEWMSQSSTFIDSVGLKSARFKVKILLHHSSTKSLWFSLLVPYSLSFLISKAEGK